jgi:hypothetical protein
LRATLRLTSVPKRHLVAPKGDRENSDAKASS